MRAPLRTCATTRCSSTARAVPCSMATRCSRRSMPGACARSRSTSCRKNRRRRDRPRRASSLHERVVATPHLGGSTYEALERIALELAGDVVRVLGGRPASGAVNAPMLHGADAERASAFIDLAHRLGTLVPQLFDEALRTKIALVLQGELEGVDAEPFVAALLAGALPLVTDRRVTLVNAGCDRARARRAHGGLARAGCTAVSRRRWWSPPATIAWSGTVLAARTAHRRDRRLRDRRGRRTARCS